MNDLDGAAPSDGYDPFNLNSSPMAFGSSSARKSLYSSTNPLATWWCPAMPT